MAKIDVHTDEDRDILLKLGLRISTLRVEKGLTQFRLGLLSGCTQSYICDLELGRRNPSVIILKRIAHALGCSLETLFKDVS